MRNGIAIAGTVMVDEIKSVKGYPAKSELTTIEQMKRSMGGAVSNCSLSLAHIDPDLPIEIIAYVGEDEKGQYVYEGFSKYENIDLSKVKFTGDTPFTDVIFDEIDKTRTFYTYKGNSTAFNEDAFPLTEIKAKILHVAYVLLLDALDKEDEEYGTKLAKLLHHAQKEGIQTSIDIVSENKDRYEKVVPPALKYTNYCIVNEYEAGKSTGIELREQDDSLIGSNIKEALTTMKRMGVQDWVVIHAPEASFGYNGQTFYSLPSLLIDKNRIKGTVGAGDAYAAGILYSAEKGNSLYESMKIATASAASSLLEEDSASGVKDIHTLKGMYDNWEKREEIAFL
ncbi:carbohydrate kinase family protein [Gracilibacillus salitolerans]|uniref:Carbohydrate kinase family protein n=1 Tax=Gracilibacillus salitolerans TaxID=2663022 RepID=A0A5Q2TMC3_9BACI|nr:carbohydrate kinase family protein [Gracilibacillus salitolerans]QGH35926.1 carbohydrate kinase family protein [Gracilibacillus salitolerans]